MRRLALYSPHHLRCSHNQLLNSFEGKLTSSKWAKLANGSQDAALRRIEDLAQKGVWIKDTAGGWSTSYPMAAN
jgi:Fic family protein